MQLASVRRARDVDFVFWVEKDREVYVTAVPCATPGSGLLDTDRFPKSLTESRSAARTCLCFSAVSA
jgi:hypothetical protein